MRGQLREGLGELEVIRELHTGVLLAVAHPGDHPAPRPHLLAQGPDQVGVFGEALHQDGAGAVQRGGGVGHAFVGIDVRRGGGLWFLARIGEQPLGQRFQPGLPGDLRLGPALRLKRQVEVLQPGLGVDRHNLRLELVVELALLADRVQDRRAALLELAQIVQPLLQGAQLRVVQPAGGFLAVPGDERHGGPTVEQPDSGAHLPLGHPQLISDPLVQRRRCHAHATSSRMNRTFKRNRLCVSGTHEPQSGT